MSSRAKTAPRSICRFKSVSSVNFLVGECNNIFRSFTDALHHRVCLFDSRARKYQFVNNSNVHSVHYIDNLDMFLHSIEQ
jgi:hypothetical protein